MDPKTHFLLFTILQRRVGLFALLFTTTNPTLVSVIIDTPLVQLNELHVEETDPARIGVRWVSQSMGLRRAATILETIKNEYSGSYYLASI